MEVADGEAALKMAIDEYGGIADPERQRRPSRTADRLGLRYSASFSASSAAAQIANLPDGERWRAN